MTNKILVFDMDGTIADLYGVGDWLVKLRAEDESPYVDARPLYDMEKLRELLNDFRACGWKVVVTSWLSKGGSREYNNKVREAKKEWLNKYRFPWDEVHIVKYGTTKANCTRAYGGFQVLVDDNENVRKGWNLGSTINANEDIMKHLYALLRVAEM